MAKTKRRRHRCWSDAQKSSICTQARASGASVSQIAKRHDVHPSQIFDWLKNPKFSASLDKGEAEVFLPVELDTSFAGDKAPEGRVSSKAPSVDQLLKITVRDVCTISVYGDYDAGALSQLVRGLS